MLCSEVTPRLDEAAAGTVLLDSAQRRHVETCLRCQAEMVRYRRLLRSLRELRTEVIEPAPGLVPEILAAIEEAGERSALRSLVHGRRAAYLGGLAAAATAAAAGGAIVYVSRSRRRFGLAS